MKIRLFRILLLCFFGKKDQSPLQPVETNFRISPFDLELSVTAASSYGVFRLLASWDYFFKKRSIYGFFKEGNTSYAYSETIRFKRATKLFDRVRVITQPIYWDEKMLYLQHKFYVKDEIKAISISRVAGWGRNGSIAPKDLLSGLEGFDGPIPEVVARMDEMNDAINQL